MDWEAFEAAWCDNGCRAIARLAAAHPEERLYAAAFHLFYSDGSQILPPALAANAESAVTKPYEVSTRFTPAEWRWDVIDEASEAMRPWYERLTALAQASGSEAETDALDTAHDRAIARICRKITASARQGRVHPNLPPDFVVAVLADERGDEAADLLRASVDPRVLATVPGLLSHVDSYRQ
ncbi:DUF4303 domain-containing protein [Streptomyces lomondensis]|nr:DUF4303 domain-containing protein [Streptomyces lomondensis]MCF0081665.1 DUF4303 domain-containing protein [Streptomyces lomondensis]